MFNFGICQNLVGIIEGMKPLERNWFGNQVFPFRRYGKLLWAPHIFDYPAKIGLQIPRPAFIAEVHFSKEGLKGLFWYLTATTCNNPFNLFYGQLLVINLTQFCHSPPPPESEPCFAWCLCGSWEPFAPVWRQTCKCIACSTGLAQAFGRNNSAPKDNG